MKLLAHRIDMVDCARIGEVVDRHGERFLSRVFTQTELDYCMGRKRQTEHLAGRFAAKEAVFKVLGTGWQKGISWLDVEVVNALSGQPIVNLTGHTREIAESQGITSVLISITHIETHAVASAIGAGSDQS